MQVTLNFLHDSGIPPHNFSGFDIFETPYAYVAKMIGPRIIVRILKFNLVSSILSAQNIQLEVSVETTPEENADNLKESLDKMDPWMARKMEEENKQN